MLVGAWRGSMTAWDATCSSPATTGMVALVVVSRGVPATVPWRRRVLGPAPRRCGGAQSSTANGEARRRRGAATGEARRRRGRIGMARRRPAGSAQSNGDVGGVLRRDGAWREVTSTGELPLLPSGTAPSHPSNCVTWRQNERPDGDGEGSQRGNGDG